VSAELPLVPGKLTPAATPGSCPKHVLVHRLSRHLPSLQRCCPQAEPPFAITAVSAALPLVPGKFTLAATPVLNACLSLQRCCPQAEPPFAITVVSSALPLVPGKHPRVPAWDHISFPLSLQFLEDTNQVCMYVAHRRVCETQLVKPIQSY
jgi:hypothetical protein